MGITSGIQLLGYCINDIYSENTFEVNICVQNRPLAAPTGRMLKCVA